NFYEPFGEIYSGNESSRYLYTGQELDQDTDLYYYGARYYDPSIPLFIQPDPLIQDIYTPADLNRYAYVRNNPYKYTDPSGNFAFYFGIQGQIGALIGATSSGGLVITYSPSQGFQVGVYDKIGKGGVTTPTLSAAFESGIAPLVNSLSEFEGSSYDAGFDIGEGASAGFGISLPRTNEGTISLNGASLEGSATLTDANLPLPASAYATISETSTICFFGCKDKEIKKIKLSNIREYLSIEQLYKLNAKTKTTGGAIYSEVKSEEDSEKDKEKDNKCGATMSCTGRQ
ncbi:RHS repeat-associated core domain-containing protein, partial [Candidatus Pacearchaeota archaeon]|nr:RHS repeat-associated core domain-containing protein [Candidatus Pacearchaeota archaeon]